MYQIAIVGAGAIGGIVAAKICNAGLNDVTVCVRAPFDHIEVQHPGGTMSVEPAQLASPAEARPTEIVVVATKAHDTAGASEWLQALCGPRTTVAVFQNGIEHEARVAPWVNGAKVVPVVVDCPAHRTAPGRIVMRDSMKLQLPFTAEAMSIVEIFMGTDLAVSSHGDFCTVLWRKLCLNVTGVIPALENEPLGVLRRPGIAAFAHDLICECIAVARAEGARLDDSLADELIASLQQAPADALTSMLQDRRAGRPLEVDARNGAVIRFGEKHGIATPANRDVLRRAAVLSAGA
jgi:2-dehydropantoate 2-reductase